MTTLDPEARALLDLLAAENSNVPYETLTPAEARANQFRFAELLDPGEPVASVEHRFMPGPTADLPIRIYRPMAGRDEQPALVYFHGSGWVVGNIGVFDGPSRTLANRTSCVVIAVNYQKAPEHPFPVPFNDAYATIEWVAEHADELAIDRSRIGVIGDSAGGTLAAAVCLKARDHGGPAIAAQVLIHAPFQFGVRTGSMEEFATGYLLETAAVEWFASQYLGDPQHSLDPLAAPLCAPSLSGLPPALVVTAECDPLRDEGEEFGARLASHGTPTIIRRFDGTMHAFYGMTPHLTAADRLFDEIGAFTTAQLA